MPGATNIQAIPYPIGTEVVGKAPSEVFQPMVGAIETRLNMRFASTAARDAAIPSPVEGMECFTGTGTGGTKWIYVNGAWKKEWLHRTVSNYTSGFESGFTGGVSVVQDGKDIAIYVDLTGTIATGARTLASARIPEEQRWTSPQESVAHNPRGVAYLWGGNGSGHLYVDSSGNIGVVNSQGASATRVQGVVKYTLP